MAFLPIQTTSRHNQDKSQVICLRCATESRRISRESGRKGGKVSYIPKCEPANQTRRKVVPMALDQIRLNYHSSEGSSVPSTSSSIKTEVKDEAKDPNNNEFKPTSLACTSSLADTSLVDTSLVDDVFVLSMFDSDIACDTKPKIETDLKINMETQPALIDDSNIQEDEENSDTTNDRDVSTYEVASLEASLPNVSQVQMSRWRNFRLNSRGELVRLNLRLVLESESIASQSSNMSNLVQSMTVEIPIIGNVDLNNERLLIRNDQLDLSRHAEFQEAFQALAPALPAIADDQIVDLNDPDRRPNCYRFKNLKIFLENVLRIPVYIVSGIHTLFNRFVSSPITRVRLSLSNPEEPGQEEDVPRATTTIVVNTKKFQTMTTTAVTVADLDEALSELNEETNPEGEVTEPIKLCKFGSPLSSGVQAIKVENLDLSRAQIKKEIKNKSKAFKRKHEHCSHVKDKNKKKLKKMHVCQAEVLQKIIKKECTCSGSSDTDDE